MGFSMNKVMIIGNVGQPPKINQGATGKRTATFSVATSEKWKAADGTQRENTEWHNIFILAEHAATFVANYVGKGDQVIVEGQLQTKEYTDRDGNSRKSTSVIVKDYAGSIGLLKAKETGFNDNGNDDGYEDLDHDDYEDLDKTIPF